MDKPKQERPSVAQIIEEVEKDLGGEERMSDRMRRKQAEIAREEADSFESDEPDPWS